MTCDKTWQHFGHDGCPGVGFGFTVTEVYEKWDDEKGYVLLDPPHWQVNLPHQCESWDIAGDIGDGVSHDEALALLTAFIQEAQGALEALTEKREVPA